jgi:hypothetical protein
MVLVKASLMNGLTQSAWDLLVCFPRPSQRYSAVTMGLLTAEASVHWKLRSKENAVVLCEGQHPSDAWSQGVSSALPSLRSLEKGGAQREHLELWPSTWSSIQVRELEKKTEGRTRRNSAWHSHPVRKSTSDPSQVEKNSSFRGHWARYSGRIYIISS